MKNTLVYVFLLLSTLTTSYATGWCDDECVKEVVTTQIHYNILAEQSGKMVSTRWLPDNGACIYRHNPLK